VSLLLVPVVRNPVFSAVLIAVAVAASMFTLGAAWSTCMDVAGNNAGVVSATMNTAGQIGSLLCPLLVAYTLKWFSDWNISLYVMGILFLIGVVCWLMIDPRKRIFES
jgi:MFS-type transporter involved in bile tolerance (Atg22 family)